jgi:hypothetical protein
MTGVTLVIVLAMSATPSPLRQPSAPLPVERAAVRMLADEAQTFSALGDLADRLQAALANPGEAPETSGRLALLWVRAVRRTLGTIPMTLDGTKHEPYRTWLAAHDADVNYSEPAGQWLMNSDNVWRLHDAHRQTTSAEPLAWEVVTNGLPGECEGYPPCYLAGLDRLHAEYLRRHPGGAHAAEAVEQIRQSNEQSVSLATGAKGHEFFNPATDCVDLVPKADAVRASLVQSGADARAAIGLTDKLRALCP